MKIRVWILTLVVLLTVGCSSKGDNDIKNSVNNSNTNTNSKTEEKLENEGGTEKERDNVETSSIKEEEIYFIANSDKEKLTLDQIIHINDKDLSFTRNEIFARKGYVFENSKYKEYFSKQSWYKPLDDNSKVKLNDIETYNVEKLKEFEDFLKDKSENLEIKNLNVFSSNEEASVDLNNDGEYDKIFYETDGETYKLRVNNLYVEEYGEALLDKFAVVDIDSDDNYKEIIISEYGPSADYFSTYYYYDGKNLIKMGNTEGIFEDGINIDGSGIIKDNHRADILQTWWFINTFKLDKSHKIINIPKEIYRTDSEVTVIKTLDLQVSRNDDDNLLVVLPGEKATIIGTDNERWCLIQKSDGIRGWMDNEAFGIDKDPSDFLEGLNYAD